MLATVYGDDTQYASNRLSGCLIRDVEKKKLFYVQDVLHRDRKIYANQILRDGLSRDPCYLKLDEADVSPIPLGYANINTKAVYVMRQASRQYRQGTNFSNTIVEGAPFRMRDNRGDWLLFWTPCFDDYPPVGEALAMLDDVFTGVAVSRSFKFDDKGEVHHRMSKCGKLNLDNGQVILDRNKEYLTELLEEEGLR